MGKIKAVIFDLDGVLVDSSDWHYQALSKALAAHGFGLTREEHSRRYEGLPTREKLKTLSSKKGLPAALHQAVSELKQRYTFELIERECLVLEDQPSGLKAACDSGAHVVKVENSKDVCYTFIKDHISAIERVK